MKNKIYMCNHCGNIIIKLEGDDTKISCCENEMQELNPNTVDAALEKHVPVVKMCDNIVSVDVGKIEHPMLDNHFITWIMIETENGIQLKHLNPNDKPSVKFYILDDKVKCVYAYCNTHGLWSKRID